VVAPGPVGAPDRDAGRPLRRGLRGLPLAGFALLALALSCLLPSAARAAGDCLVVDDFSKTRVGEFPLEWKPRKDAGREVYTVMEEPALRFLRAVSRGLGIQAARSFEWDLAAYPVLSWQWRPLEFPAGSDERSAKTNDSALAVYAVFPHTPVSVKSVKYIWSARVPVGHRLESSRGLTQVRVLRSGAERKGEWVEERVNVREDFRALFDEKDPLQPVGIAVLTDSDDTKGSARGDYAQFRVCRP